MGFTAVAGRLHAAFRAHGARTEPTPAPDGTEVTALVARVCTVVQDAAAVPIHDDVVKMANMGRGPGAEASLVAIARTAHAMGALLGKQLPACEWGRTRTHDPVTTVAAVGIAPARARPLLAAARLAEWLVGRSRGCGRSGLPAGWPPTT